MKEIKLGKLKSENIKAIDDNFKYIDDFCVKYTENKIYVKNYIPRFADTTGKIITNSNVEVDDIGIINSQGYKAIRGNEFNFAYGNNSTGRFYLNFRGADNEISYYQLCTGKGDYTKARLKLADPVYNDEAVTKNYLENVYKPSSSFTIYDFDVKYGNNGRYTTDSIAPVYQGLVNAYRGNMLAFMPANAIQLEYSTDGGETWAENTAKIKDVRNAFTINAGDNAIWFALNSPMNNQKQMRITIAGSNDGGWGYFSFRNIYIYGTFQHESFVKVDGLHYDNTWRNLLNNTKLSGWAGPNFINLQCVFGGHQNWRYRKLQFTFSCPNMTGDSTDIPSVNRFYAYGINYSGGSNLASLDHLYKWDIDQNAYFPSKVYVSDGYNYTNVNSAFNPTTQLKNIDTRDNNFLPSEYYKSDGKRLTYEFKSTSAVGLSNLFSQEFVSLFTATPWGDSSGGRPIQIAIGQNKNNNASADFAFRNASSDSAWNSWQLDSDLKIKTISTQYVVIWNLEPGIYKLTYIGTVRICYSGTSTTTYASLANNNSSGGRLLFISQYSTTVKLWKVANSYDTTTPTLSFTAGYSTSSNGAYYLTNDNPIPKNYASLTEVNTSTTSSTSNYVKIKLAVSGPTMCIAWGYYYPSSTGFNSVTFPTDCNYIGAPTISTTYYGGTDTKAFYSFITNFSTTGFTAKMYKNRLFPWIAIGHCSV